MNTQTEPSHVLVREIVRTGLMITGVLEDLLEGLPDDAFPGEDEAQVLLEMLAGTVQPAVAAAGEETVQEMIALLGALGDRVLSDLQAAAVAARAREEAAS
jgi:hypothetical protein